MQVNTESMTELFALLIGVYMIAGGLSGFVSGQRWNRIMDGFRQNDALTFISGVFVFVLGAVMVSLHNQWDSLLAIIVSVVGWAALIEGLVLIVIPAPLFVFAKAFTGPTFARLYGILIIAFGAWLVWQGASAVS